MTEPAQKSEKPASSPPVHPEEVDRVLIRSANWLGDLVMEIPLIRNAAHLFEPAEIDVLVRSGFEPILELLPYVDNVITFDKSGGIQETLEDFKTARTLEKNNYDVSIVVPRSFRSAVAPMLAGIPFRVGYGYSPRSFLLTDPVPPPEDRWARHRVYNYLGLLTPWLPDVETYPAGDAPELPITEESKQTMKDRMQSSFGLETDTKKPVAINPGAMYGTAKRWLPDRYAQLCKQITKQSRRHCVVLGAPGEEDLAEQIAFAAGDGTVSLAGQTDVADLAVILSLCEALVTNDTGTVHVADAVGLPSVVIFGPTSPTATAPFHDNHRIVREPVHCSPCQLRTCPIDHRCMTRIPVDRVHKSILKYLE